jgi:hypothetical protein
VSGPDARATASHVARWRANLQGEVDGIAAYLAMAESERDGTLATVCRRLADAERRHAAIWEAKPRAAEALRGMPAPSWRTRILAAVAQRFGAGVVAATIAGREAKDQTAYDAQPEAAGPPSLATSARTRDSSVRSAARVFRVGVSRASRAVTGPVGTRFVSLSLGSMTASSRTFAS